MSEPRPVASSTRRRALVVVAVAVVLGALAALRVALPVDPDVTRFLPTEPPEVKAFATLVERLHMRDVVLVGVETSASESDLFTAQHLRYLRALADALAACPEVFRLTSLGTLSVIENGPAGTAHVSLIPPEVPDDPAALGALRARVLGQDYLASLVSADARATLMVVQLRRDALPADAGTNIGERLRTAALAVPRPPDTSLHFSGAPYLEAAGPTLTGAELRWLGPGMGVALLVLVALVMRSFRGTLIVVVTAGLATVIALGLLGWTGIHPSLVASALPLVVLNVACAAALCMQRPRVVLLGASAGSAACLGWLLAGTEPLRELGVLLAVSTLVAALVALTVGRALTSLFPLASPRTDGPAQISLLERWAPTASTTARRAFIVGLAAVLAASCAVQFPRLAPQTDVHEDFPAGSAPAEADRFLLSRFGGYLHLQVLVTGDLADPQVIARLAAFEDMLWAVPGVVRVQSLPQVLAVVHESLEGTRRLPRTRAEVEHLGFLARANDSATRLLIDDGWKTTVMQIAIAGDEATTEARIRVLADELARGETPSRAERLVALSASDPAKTSEVAAALAAATPGTTATPGTDAAARAIAGVLAREIGEDEMIDLRDEGALARLGAAVAAVSDLGADAFEALLRREAAPDELTDAASFAKVTHYLYARVDKARREALAAELAGKIQPLLAPASTTAARTGRTIDPRMTSLRARRVAETLEDQLHAQPADLATAPALAVTVTGEPMIMRALGRALTADLALGLGAGLAFAALVLLVGARSARALLALVPVAAALVGAAGVMGAAGFPLELTTPVVLALAVWLGLFAGTAALGGARPVAILPGLALLVFAFAAYAPLFRLGVVVAVAVALAVLAARLVTSFTRQEIVRS